MMNPDVPTLLQRPDPAPRLLSRQDTVRVRPLASPWPDWPVEQGVRLINDLVGTSR
jgi:hypothetical protein